MNSRLLSLKRTRLAGRWPIVVNLLAVLILFTMPPASPAATNPSTDEYEGLEKKVIEGLQKKYENISTYKVRFHQTLSSPVFGKVIREAGGVIYYRKPGKIRWEYKEPDERLYLVDGEFFWDYDPSAGQVLKIPLKDAFAGDVPRGFLFGAGNIQKDFEVELAGETAEGYTPGYRLKLEPKEKDLKRAVSDLVLVVNPKDYSVVASSFTDAQGNVNRYEFTDIEVNPKLKPELFAFKVPKGVKVMLPVTQSEIKEQDRNSKDEKNPENKKQQP